MAGERILIVDDEPTVLDACARALSRRRFEVHAAAGGAEAISRLSGERFDLLLTDIKMPEVDGLELVRRAHELDPEMPCVVLTGHGSLDTALESIRLGVSGFVVKPFTLQELARAVEAPLEKARLTRENIRLKALVPLFEISHTLGRAHDFGAVYDAVLTAARVGIQADACRLLLAPGHAGSLDVPVAVAQRRGGESDDPLTAVTAAAPIWWPAIARAFQLRAEPLIVGAASGGDEFFGPTSDGLTDPSEVAIAGLQRAGLRDAIVLGLMVSDQLVGALLMHRAPRSRVARSSDIVAQISESDREWLGILATLAGGALMRARLLAERAAAEERLQSLFDSAACGLLAIDATGRIIEANPTAEEMLGYAPRQTLGRAVTSVLETVWDAGPSLTGGAHPVMAALDTTQVIKGVTLQVKRADGSLRALQLETVPVPTADATLVQLLVSFIDVTDRKLAEIQTLELAREQVARDEAQAAVRARDEFVSVAAHELKTPVASLRLAAQLLMRTVETEASVESEKLRKLSETVAEQSNKISRLIGLLLDVSRLEAGKLVVKRSLTDIVPLVQGVATAARAHTEKHVIVVQAPATPVWARIDPLRIEQVVWNLVDNAIKYSPLAGVIELAVSQPRPDIVSLEVRDRGQGIPSEKLSRIFERFYQAHTVGQEMTLEGLGLGLYISREIVELHGGEIAVENAPGGGARFIVSLPTA